MATLQKIRNRGGILVSIVIGLALVAFIVGDALSSGASLLNRSKNKVGEIGGESISIQDFQDKVAQNGRNDQIDEPIALPDGRATTHDSREHVESDRF